MKRLVFTLLFTVLGLVLGNAQTYTADAAKSELSVSGTSSLHDWHCAVKSFSGTINATVENGKVTKLSDFNFSFNVTSLDSGKGAMDKKMYEALKEENNPKVTYKGSEVIMNADGTAKFKGQMTMAGVTKYFETIVKLGYEGSTLELNGSKAFKLAEFKIDPPTAMFGTIKTGEEVSIHYNISLTTK
ncbi:YceI family protein [Neptunitalea lumnitzerae]|uniref:Lipid/polyisoprenoid-binding YceI-like domain-containing protein n=1 Tax=Neptunitalea lumnitzerae TaxID=2965509 RepID=A0ABQ5MJA8_9FLAO|nr:YceI family protein [Neptunitalea sp. Y10]GLB49017.1 hypothetical protein Y10_13850 [Neptunitalea sp. Y10]